MITKKHGLTALAALAITTWAFASPGGAEKMLEELRKKFPKTEFTKVLQTDVPHIYEVQMGENVAFVSDKNPRFFVLGRMFDTQTLRDVTRSSSGSGAQAGSRSVSIEPRTFPIGDAVKTVRGTGASALYVFSDPACPYCKKLEGELERVDDVTIYTFLLPFQARSRDLSLSVWCSTDRAREWSRVMTGAGSTSAADCANPLDRNLEFANKLGIGATPTLIFNDGSRIDGYVTAGEIKSQLSASSARRPTNVTVKETQP